MEDPGTKISEADPFSDIANVLAILFPYKKNEESQINSNTDVLTE